MPPPPEPPRTQWDVPLRDTPQSALAHVTPAILRAEVAAATSQQADVTPAMTETSPPPAMDARIGVGAGGLASGSGSGGDSGGSGTGGSGTGGDGNGDGPTFLKAD